MIFAVVIAIVLFIIYLITADFSKREFFSRLEERAFVTAQYFLEKDELSDTIYATFIKKYQQVLPTEIIQIYNMKNENEFLPKNVTENFSFDTLNMIRTRNILRFNRGDRLFVGIFYRDNQGNFDIIVSAVDVYGKSKLSNLLIIMLLSFSFSIGLIFILGIIFSRRAPQSNKQDHKTS